MRKKYSNPLFGWEYLHRRERNLDYMGQRLAPMSPSPQPPASANLPATASPPAANLPTTREPSSPATPPTNLSHANQEEELDLLLFSSPEFEDTPPKRPEVSPLPLKRDDTERECDATLVRRAPLCSVVVKPAGHRVSYKEALLKPQAHQPRSLCNPAAEGHQWHDALPRKDTRSRKSVWSRLGSESKCTQEGRTRAGGVWDRLQVDTSEGKLLALLKAKAGRRCFNCFASDHQIAQCRDPPKCLLCSRFGHKARYCNERREKSRKNREEHVQRVPDKKKMDFPEFVPGAPEHRPQLVVACAARTQEIRDAERQRELHTVVGVQIDARVPLGAGQVARDVRQQLRIPDRALEVQALGPATFILRFGSPELRNSTLAMHIIPAGCTELRLMPWSRRVCATAGSLRYRVRVCLEGVPSHAWNVDSVTQLFCPPSFIDDVDFEVFREAESSCFNLWVWMADPNALPKKAILKIEEPFARTGPTGLPILRHEAARALDYEVLIHLERVLDYAPLQSSSSHDSYESAISGIPDNGLEEEWPARHFFSWIPGVPDGERLLIHGGRVSARDRLGGRRDRSPPADGGAEGSRGGGRSFRQLPPATWRDVPGGGGNGQRHSQAGGYRGRRHAPVQLQWRERRARAPQHGAAATTAPALFNADGKEALSPFPAAAIDRGFYGDTTAERQAADPMQDEVLLCTQQLLQQGWQGSGDGRPGKSIFAFTEMEYAGVQRIANRDMQADPMRIEAQQPARGFPKPPSCYLGSHSTEPEIKTRTIVVPFTVVDVCSAEENSDPAFVGREIMHRPEECVANQQERLGTEFQVIYPGDQTSKVQMPMQNDEEDMREFMCCAERELLRDMAMQELIMQRSTDSPLEDAGREADQNGTPCRKDVDIDLTSGEQPQTQSNGLDCPRASTKDIHAIVGQPTGNAQLVPPPEQIAAQGPTEHQQNTPVDQAHQDADLQSLQSGVAQKNQKKTVFTKQLQPPVLLLSDAYPKAKTATTDRALKPSNLNSRTPSSRKSARIASKGKNDMTMEEQATALLMKKCGLLQENKLPDSPTRTKFSTQFTEPIEQETVGNLREAFGLADDLGTIALHAED